MEVVQFKAGEWKVYDPINGMHLPIWNGRGPALAYIEMVKSGYRKPEIRKTA